MNALCRRFSLLLALAAVVACDTEDAGDGLEGDADEAQSEIEDDSPASTGTGDSDSGDSGDGGAAPALLVECGLEAACDVLTLPIDEAAAKQRYDADGLCLFTALTSPTPATLLQIEVAYPSSTANLDLAIVDDGTILRQSYGRGEDVGEWLNPPMRCTLQGPAFFVACAESYDPACLDPEAWVVGCEPLEALACPAP